MAAETTWTPLIISASFDPSPAITGQPTLLRVVVVDVFGKEQEDIRMAGEYYSGEV